MQATANLAQADLSPQAQMTDHEGIHPGNEGARERHPEHTHGTIDRALLSSERGIWAIKWSLAALVATALLQVFVVSFTGSVALLADTVHNFGDALTSIPLWIAFTLSRRPANKRFTYGYGRAEDIAGLFILLMILISGLVAGYESFRRLIEPQTVRNLWAVIAAAIIGFLGNEGVAWFRIRVGKQIGSAALVADGYHARVDGLTSLVVLAGAIGVWLGFPLADPVVGLLITAAIFKILWDIGKSVFLRIMDAVDPDVVDDIHHTVKSIPEVIDVNDIRVRWMGHRMHAELSVSVDPELNVSQGHHIAMDIQHQLLHKLIYLASASIHIDPMNLSGETYHKIMSHEHNELHDHSH
jgi:cation diffusion facilitator family transporter